MVVNLDSTKLLVLHVHVIILVSAVFADLAIIIVNDTFPIEVVSMKKSLNEVFPPDVGFFP